MIRTRSITSNAYSANLTELVGVKMASYELEMKEFKALLCTLSNPLMNFTLYTEKEVAELMKISLSSIKKIRSEGKIHYRFVNGTVRYSMSDLLEYQESCKR